MNKNQVGWAAGVAGLLVLAALGCADKTPEATASAAPEYAASPAKVVASATAAAPAKAPAPAKASAGQAQAVTMGTKLPKGKVEQRVASPNKLHQVVWMDQGESGDWAWRSLYVTSGARTMNLGRYSELSRVKWNPDGTEFTAEVQAGTDFNQLTTYSLRYRIGDKTYQRQVLKVETVESAG